MYYKSAYTSRPNYTELTDAAKSRPMYHAGMAVNDGLERVAAAIKRRREERDLTQEELAAELHVSVGSVRNWEQGKREPRPEWRATLARFFKVDPSEFAAHAREHGDFRRVAVVEPTRLDGQGMPMKADPERSVPVFSQNETILAVVIEGTAISRIAPPGAVAIFDYSDTELVDGRLYLIRSGAQAIIRRYRTSPARLEPDSYDAHETIFPDGPLDVVGRVILTQTAH